MTDTLDTASEEDHPRPLPPMPVGTPEECLGDRMVVEGIAGDHQRRLAILNPRYELLSQDP